MTDETTMSGSCYCGEVTVEVHGQPMASGLCHCEDCQKFHAAPFMAWNVWPSAQVEVTAGEINASEKSPHLKRVSCRKCGGNVMGILPDVDMTVVFPSTLKASGLTFEPQFHQFYDERVLEIADGVPKFVDKPEAFGGSGVQIDEPDATAWKA